METMTMTKSDRINRTLFNVTKRENEDGRYGLFSDTGYKLSTVSKEYKLINNREFIMPFVEKFGETAFKRVTSLGNGKAVVYEIETGLDIEIAPGDILKQRMLAVNSYDKTKAYKFVLGAFRSYCFNGLYNGLAFVNIQRIHKGNFDINEPIREVLDNYGDLSQYDHWRKMAKVEVSEESQKEFIEGFQPYDTEERFSASGGRNAYIKSLALRYNSISSAPKEGNTVWGLYNRLNWSISRAFQTKDQRECVKLNNKLESSLMKHFSLN